MRSVCAGLSGAILLGALLCVAPGCGGGATNLEEPEVKKNPSMSDMPGFNKMQEQLKKSKKTR